MTTAADKVRIESSVERRIARVLNVGTAIAIAFVAIGVVLLLARGVDPLSASVRPTDPRTVLSLLASFEPAGFIWSGVLLVVCLPIGRVLVALTGFIAEHERRMVAIAIAVLVVIAVSILVASTVEV